MDNLHNRMRKHRRAPPIFTLVGNAETPSAQVPATTQAPTPALTTQFTRQVTTPVVAATTTAVQTQKNDKNNDKNDDKKQDDDLPTTSTTPTIRVAVTSPTTTQARTQARTTSAVSTTPPVVTTSRDDANTIAAFSPTTSQFQQFTVTRTTKTASNPTSTPSGLASPSAVPDDGPSVGTIAGYAAAALAGIAVVSILAIWVIRRKRRREEDADIDAAPFNRNSWLRHSTMIHDDTPTPAATMDNFPPPRHHPEMIDRSFNATPVANYTGMNPYPQNNFGYATQPSYQPGAVIFSPSSANTSFGPGGGPATPLPYSPGYDPTTPNPFDQQAGYTEVTRGSPPSPFNPYHHQQQFDEIQHQMTPSAPDALAEDRPLSPRAPSPTIEATPPVLPPVVPDTPGAADTFTRVPDYPELSPAPTSAHGHVVEVHASAYEGQATPVQYDFAEAPQSPVAPSANTGPQPLAAPQPAAGRTLTRPETVYDPEDAYGGI